MAFATGKVGDVSPVGSGELIGVHNIILAASSPNIENNLVLGRFAKIDGESLENIDGSATPVIAGIPLRRISAAVESGGTVDTSLVSTIDYIRQGLVTVDVVNGQTPIRFGAVFVSNGGNADDGKALALIGGSGVVVNAIFIQEIRADIWEILLNGILQ